MEYEKFPSEALVFEFECCLAEAMELYGGPDEAGVYGMIVRWLHSDFPQYSFAVTYPELDHLKPLTIAAKEFLAAAKQHDYVVGVYKEGWYWAEVDEIPGCMTQAPYLHPMPIRLLDK